MLRAILFDLDGTLAPFDQEEFVRAYFGALTKRLAPMGYHADTLVAALWKGVAAMIANDGGVTNRQAFWDRFVRELGVQALALEGILNDFYAREFNTARSCLKEDADRGPLLRQLREKGYRLVLATNPIFPAVAVETRLGWVGLKLEDFEYVTTYEDCRRSKPNLDYYRDILARTGLAAGECLMVGNNPADDMAAAELGMSVYLVTDCLENPGGIPIDPYPHGSFRELEKYLAGLPEL